MPTPTNPYPDVPAPVCALFEWADVTSSPHRYFEGPRRLVDDIGVQVYCAGAQYPDGTIDPEIVVHQLHADKPIKTAAAARQLARAIMAVADELDRFTT